MFTLIKFSFLCFFFLIVCMYKHFYGVIIIISFMSICNKNNYTLWAASHDTVSNQCTSLALNCFSFNRAGRVNLTSPKINTHMWSIDRYWCFARTYIKAASREIYYVAPLINFSAYFMSAYETLKPSREREWEKWSEEKNGKCFTDMYFVLYYTRRQFCCVL